MKLNNGISLFATSAIAVLSFGYSGYQFLNPAKGNIKIPTLDSVTRQQAQTIATNIAPTVVSDPFAGWDAVAGANTTTNPSQIAQIAGQTPNAPSSMPGAVKITQDIMSGGISVNPAGGSSHIRPLPVPTNQNDYSGMNGSISSTSGINNSGMTSSQPSMGSANSQGISNPSGNNVVTSGINPGSVVSPQSLASGQAAPVSRPGMGSTADAGNAQKKSAIVLRALISTDRAYAYVEFFGKPAKKYVKGDKLMPGMTIVGINAQAMSVQVGKEIVRIRVGQELKQ